ncbi:MAG: RNA-binding cell elongation regulator Jag/EloR [Acidimicrobiales bacterium]
MEWVETTGRSVEDAKEAALDQLGVDEQDAEFEIVEEPRFGLFGRLRAEARVRARVRPTKPRPKEERRDRRGRQRTGSGGGSSSSGDGRDSGVDTKVLTGAAPAAPGRNSKSGESSVDAGGPSSGAGGTAGGARRRSRRGHGRGPSAAGTDPTGAPDRSRPAALATKDQADDDHESDATTPGGGMDVSLEDQAVVAREFLEGLAGRMSLVTTIDISQPEEDTVELDLQGQDLGLLIGPKGATLLAIQDLTRTVVQRKTSAGNGRIQVDVSGYRRKRKDALARFSRQVAEEVQSTGSRRVLEPMSAADRKVVHDTVNQIEGVATISEGEDPRRRVVIVPVAAGS